MKKVIWFTVLAVVLIACWYFYKTFFSTQPAQQGSTAAKPATVTPKATVKSSQGFPIHYGDNNDSVKKMQHGLNFYYGVYLVEDGIYGDKTKQALLGSGFPVDVVYDDFLKIIHSSYVDQAMSNFFSLINPF